MIGLHRPRGTFAFAMDLVTKVLDFLKLIACYYQGVVVNTVLIFTISCSVRCATILYKQDRIDPCILLRVTTRNMQLESLQSGTRWKGRIQSVAADLQKWVL
jgi:hypothetical protein